MISALAWIRKGVAAEKPRTYEMTEDEYKRIQEIATEEIADAKKELKTKSNELDSDILNDPALKDFDLEHYDDDDDDDNEGNEGEEDSEEDEEDESANTGKSINVFSNIKGLSYHNDDEEDPYITMKDDDDNNSESEEVRIFGSDNLLLVAKTEDDISNVEVCVFEDESDNLFVHHDFMLPSFPLCVEWLDFNVGRRASEAGSGNYVAVGTFEPRIEIWDVDIIDAMYPDLVLGSSDKKLLRKNKGKALPDFHTDAIMGLSWNKSVRNLLASSSADTTVKLWDLKTAKCIQSYNHHSDKVQAVQWHPNEASVMLTGGYDKCVSAFDSRAPENISWWSVGADVEGIMWDIHSPNHFYVASEDGIVRYFDIRTAQTASKNASPAPVYTLAAHDEAVSAFDLHPHVPGLLITGSIDQSVKVWNVKDNKPTMLLSRNLDVGSVFAAKFCPDSTMQLAVAGSKGETRIWDLSTNSAVRATFGDKNVAAQQVQEKQPIGVQNDEGDGDEGDNKDTIVAEMHGAAVPVSGADNDNDNDAEMDSD